MPLFNRSQKIVLVILVCVLLLFVSANVVARIVMPDILQKEISTVLDVPVKVSHAGVNFLSASLWMKDLEIQNIPDSKHPIFLSAKRMIINISFTSLVARQLIFQRVYFEEPTLNLERDEKGRLNLNEFESRLQSRFKPRFKLGKGHFFTGYEVDQFSIKGASFRYNDRWASEGPKKWLVHHLDFSFSNFYYPPQLIDPIPTSLFFSAKIEGIREGSILILGSGNFVVGERNFKIRGDFKNIHLRGINPFFSDFPMTMMDGYASLRSEAICKNDFLEVSSHIRIDELKLEEKPGFSKTKMVFGYPKKDVTQLFESMGTRPFDFDFKIAGDFNNPRFDFEKLIGNSMSQAIEGGLKKAFDQIEQKTAPPLDAAEHPIQRRTSGSGNRDKSSASFKTAVERLTGIKLPGNPESSNDR